MKNNSKSTLYVPEELRINDPSFVDEAFANLDARQSNIYHFVMRYNDYIISRHSYGIGEPLSMIEAHTLTFIEDNPGTNVTTLARYWSKTKSMLSQVVSKLEQMGYVRKEKRGGNNKTIHLYLTDTGYEISRAHKAYDIVDILKTFNRLRELCSLQELEHFYKVIAAYNQVIAEDFSANHK